MHEMSDVSVWGPEFEPPTTHVKRQVWNPSAGESGTGRSLELTGQGGLLTQ